MGMKELKKAAANLIEGRVGTREKLYDALPTLIELQTTMANMRKAITEADKLAKELSELCTDYAVNHAAVFDDGKLHKSQQGVLVGDISLNGATYHLACGYEGYIRQDGEKLTQDFLTELAEKREGWVKAAYKLDTTGVNDSHPTTEDLCAAGLVQKPKNVWSLAE